MCPSTGLGALFWKGPRQRLGRERNPLRPVAGHEDLRSATGRAELEEAGAYDLLLRRIAEVGKADGCRTREDVVRRYERLDDLIAEVCQTGRMKTPRELYGPSDRWESGIYIAVGRQGDPLFARRGHHRLAIAKLLRLPIIPATVSLVHPQAIRSGTFRRLASRSEL